LRTFTCPKDFKTAAAAQFGYSDDAVAGNISWSAKGFAALAYIWRNESSESHPYVSGFALSPWVSFNRVTNSLPTLKTKQIDVLSYGGAAEVVLSEVLQSDQHLRAKTQLNTTFEGQERSWAGTLEWQPVSNALYLSSPIPLGTHFVWEVDPIVRSIYSQHLGSPLDPIFATRNEALRSGPVLALSVAPVQNDALVPHWLQSTVFNTSYEWLKDSYSGKIYRLWNSTVTFPLDTAKHLGVQVQYQRGQQEDTGQAINLVTAGFSAKW
jgi:hypothetical protein